jgi:hypothetical protein
MRIAWTLEYTVEIWRTNGYIFREQMSQLLHEPVKMTLAPADKRATDRQRHGKNFAQHRMMVERLPDHALLLHRLNEDRSRVAAPGPTMRSRQAPDRCIADAEISRASVCDFISGTWRPAT